MARNFYRIFTENNPVMGDSKTFGIPEVKGLSTGTKERTKEVLGGFGHKRLCVCV